MESCIYNAWFHYITDLNLHVCLTAFRTDIHKITALYPLSFCIMRMDEKDIFR